MIEIRGRNWRSHISKDVKNGAMTAHSPICPLESRQSFYHNPYENRKVIGTVFDIYLYALYLMKFTLSCDDGCC